MKNYIELHVSFQANERSNLIIWTMEVQEYLKIKILHCLFTEINSFRPWLGFKFGNLRLQVRDSLSGDKIVVPKM